MLYLYNTKTAFRRLAQELNISVCYPYIPKTIKRKARLTHAMNVGCVRGTFEEGTLNRDLSTAISKRKTFEAIDRAGGEIRHPPVFSTPEEASTWTHGWLGRRDGLSAGRGITVFERGQLPLQAAQYDLCVGIIPGRAEYRIHVGRLPDGSWSTIATQQKMGVAGNESVVRNYASGVRYSLQPLKMSVKGQARAEAWAAATVQACGLDFGAVDLLQSTDGLLYVLEVNTAPGISSEPLFEAYKRYIQNYVI